MKFIYRGGHNSEIKDYNVKLIGIPSQYKPKHTSINIAISLFILSSLFYNVESLQIIGYVLLISSIFFLTITLFSVRNIYLKNKVGYKLLLFSITYLFIVELLRNISFRGIEVFACFYIAIIVLNVLSSVDLRTINTRRIKLFLSLEILLIFIPLLFGSGYSSIDGGYKSFYSTTTFLGLFCCLLTEVIILLYYVTKDRRWLWYIIPLIVLIYMSRVRTAYVGVIIVLFTLIFQQLTLTRSMKFYMFLKYIFIGTIIVFVAIYPRLDQFEWYAPVEAFVYLYTGKILLTGRNEIWAEGLQYISQSKYWGYGLDTSFIDISMHNSYLQLILESGIVGIAFVALLINYILGQVCSNMGKQYKLIFIFSLVNLLLATTEVMLFHGQMILEILVWAIMGLGLNKSYVNLNRNSTL